MDSMKVCKDCNKEYPKTTEYFYSNGYTPKGLKKFKPRCKSCEAIDIKNQKDTRLAAIIGRNPSCRLCGYNKCGSALEFHHLDPREKEYTISRLFSTRRSLSIIRDEIRKCVILCANCHREVHEGLVQVTEADLQLVE